MRHMEVLRDRLSDELIEISEGPLTVETLDIINKLTHSIKSLDTILAMAGYSREEGASYRRGRSMTTGRYISRTSGRDMKAKLEELALDAPDEKTREELHRLIDKM